MELEYQVSGMVACRRVNRRVNYQPDDVALDLSNAVYGSNTLDSRGTSWQHTLRIYNAICWGNSVTAAIPAPEEDPDYASHVYHLVERGRKATGAAVAESRQQTINHALALRYLVDEVVARRQPVTGAALCEAHRLLVTGWVRRGHRLHSRHRDCTLKCWIQPELKALLAEMAAYMATEVPIVGDREQALWRAASWHQQLIRASPFGERTAAVARMLVVAVLLRRTGYVCAMGYKEDQEEEYRRLSTRPVGARPCECCPLSGDDPESVEELAAYMKKCLFRR